MSEETSPPQSPKAPTLSDRLEARRAKNRNAPIVERESQSLGKIFIRRLGTLERLKIADEFPKRAGLALVVECVLDEEKKKVFKSIDDFTPQDDWAMVSELMDLVRSVNDSLDIEAALKN